MSVMNVGTREGPFLLDAHTHYDATITNILHDGPSHPKHGECRWGKGNVSDTALKCVLEVRAHTRDHVLGSNPCDIETC